jgi:excisionase family DNA binding protein
MAVKTAERPALLTQVEAATILGVSRQTMQRLAAAGTLHPVRIAGLGWPRYRRVDIERLIEEGRSP